MSRFYIPPECIKGSSALITGEEAHHILDVMRLKKGDKICAFDGRGELYQGKILDTANKKVKVKIESAAEDLPVSNSQITLVQALPKKNKMDYIIEKCTELGVDTIIPTQTTRTIVKLNRDKQGLRLERWQRIAREAAKQCGRTTIPKVRDLASWTDAISNLGNFDLKLLFCLSENSQRLKDVLRREKKVRKVSLFIGPEGGFTPDEIRQSEQAGWLAVSLGNSVLKSDTAALTALAMVNYELQ